MKCCSEGCEKSAQEGYDECFRHRVLGVGFSFVGGGGYTRESFHDYTINEKRRDILGDRVVGVDVEPAPRGPIR